MDQTAKQETAVPFEDMLFGTSSEPLIPILNAAIQERATDVHLDPVEQGRMVRFRVDGILHEKDAIPGEYSRRVLNQVKILTNLDIDKSFKPQEGLFTFEHEGAKHDVRVSIVPVDKAEAIHFRFLTASRQIKALEDIGLRASDRQVIRDVIKVPTGLILISGGTGTGKTTTMYALADALDLKSMVAVSIEDPVEFRNPYIRQVQVDEERGVSMYDGLRSLLRTDPDVILVGEIRDKQSAVTAARAGLSGHLVIATIHARTAAMTIDVMHNLSVPRYVIGGALRVVIHQELIRRLCPACAKAVKPVTAARQLFERHELPVPERVFEAVGCKQCIGYGYLGRIGVFEVTPINTELGQEISSGMNQKDMTDRLRKLSTQSLVCDTLHKAAEGATSMDVAMQFVSEHEE
ncbi:MAG: Flp pilus assembly complex ATPase component TadA, partial [Sedimentisphaerales bacterium]|nr:Flp pilus assembly complex ATPase component TadA [Sedimentisphaerales bacterium]